MEENNFQNKAKRFMLNEGALIIAVIGATIGFTAYFSSPKGEIALQLQKMADEIRYNNTILTNHMEHYSDKIDEETLRNEKQDLQLNEIEKNLTKILTILNK